ncbi:hypothetical protein [Pseudomonas sp. PGPR40]|uniref:hypothetical protein n=1 Tax=Pseudomonas sp. PGPR40 TaxID=2913476 RepID=UPI001EDA0A3E|nr:hypothetical protein [Pseudomonas sp. PGPR40]
MADVLEAIAERELPPAFKRAGVVPGIRNVDIDLEEDYRPNYATWNTSTVCDLATTHEEAMPYA